MADSDLTVYYNTHRLAALERILSESGSSLENALCYQLDSLYKDYVPEDEQEAIEARIAREEAEKEAAREAARRFAVIHFCEAEDDFYFTTELRKDFYSAAHLYREYLKDEVGTSTIDSLARHFEDYQMIDDLTFSVLCDAMPNDSRITALMEFDFDHSMVTVREDEDTEWRTYDLNDVTSAVYHAERTTGLHMETRRGIFHEALAGKEINMDEPGETTGEGAEMRIQL